MSAAGVVAALGAEAATLGKRVRRKDGLFVVEGLMLAISGMGPDAAAAAAQSLVTAGASGLVSWGMAGGLDPTLDAGTICLPNSIAALDGASFTTSHHWHELVAAAIASRRRVVDGTLLSSIRPLDQPAGKAAAHRDTGAVAVDMESFAIASVAAAHRLPFLAVRVVVDTAHDSVPRAVMNATADGKIRFPTLLSGLLKHPGDLPPLVRLARRYTTARRALAAVARTGALAPLSDNVSPSIRIA